MGVHVRLLLAVALFASVEVFAQTTKEATSVELVDQEGDVNSTAKNHGLDLVKLVVAGDGGFLVIDATLKGSLQDFTGGDPVVLFLDTDNRADTGVAIPGLKASKSGFEYSVSFAICAEYYGGVTSCSGASVPDGVRSVYAAASITRLTDGGVVRRVSDAAPGRVLGDVAEVRVSYFDLGIKAGATIRIVAREAHSTAPDEGILRDVLLTLK